MKKSSLVMILALVGMVGCKHKKPQVTVTDCEAVTTGKVEYFPGYTYYDSHTGKEFCEAFQDYADEFNHEHPHDQVSYGCGNIHPAEANPISHGNDAVILPKKPAKKPKKKLVAMTGDGPVECIAGYKWEDRKCVKIEETNLGIPDKAAAPAEILTTSDSGLISTTFTLSARPAWPATIGSDNNIEITDPKHELKCYGDASTGFTITCIAKSVEKAK